MYSYGWDIEYCMKLTRSQIVLFAKKINKRRKIENDFQKSIHGIEVKNKGLNVHNAVPIEDVIDKNSNNLM